MLSRLFLPTTIFTTIILSAIKIFALVDMNNAGYTNSWVDLEVPSSGNSYEMRVLRAYKSRTIYNGMFGFGWCSEFETKLETTSEGNIKISECGDGQEINFSAKEITRKDVDSTISQIKSKMKADKKYSSGSPEFWAKLDAQLLEDDAARSSYAKQFGITVAIKEGQKFMANGKEVENVVFAKGFYTRNLPDGSFQRFDLNGKMTHMYDKNGNFLKFEYQKDLLTEIADNNSRKLTFKYFPNKKIQKITGPGGIVSEYKYNQQDDLIWNKNAWAKKDSDVYNYEYNEFHNLVKASWPDKTSIAIKYDNTKDWVTSFTDRDKCTETYKYEFSPTNPKFNYWSTATKVCGKETVASNRYEFWHKQLPNGQIVLSRVQTSVNGNVRDITYHDTFGKPVTIKNNNERVDFEYYPDGLVKLKTSSVSKLEFSYDPTSKKVSQVKTTFINEKGKPISNRSTSFKYDPKGNLNYAENTEGQKITMTYDMRGRIQTITDQAKKVVKIDYDERYGKPTVVTRPGLGTIKVSYKSNGDIAKVDSAEGPTVASQVASTFNNLLDVIAPATQELYL
jgi:YD repeat-containing protein